MNVIPEQPSDGLPALLYEGILENAVDGLITIDEAGVVWHYNKACAKIFGYPAAEVIGRNVSMLMPEPHAKSHDGYMKRYHDTGKAQIIGIGREVEGRRKDGALFPMTLSVAEVKIGARKFFSASVRDIAQYRKSERDQALLAAIVSTSGDAIISKDLQGVITSWNAAAERLFGYSVAEAVGMPVTQLIPADRQDEESFILSQVHGGKVVDHFETIRVTKAGKKIAVSLTVSALRDSAGNITGASKILRDITHQKAEEEKLKRANEELEKFAYVAAHDLRAPLRNIDNLASWVLEDNKDSLNADALEKLGLLRERVARLEKLLNDILAYSRAGRVVGKPVEVDLQVLVQYIVQTHVPPGFTVKIPDALPKLVSPALPLEQIFGNLLANAVRHHDRGGGEIEVLSARRGDFYEFSVRDDGPGIPPEYHARVFEMFQTLKPRDKVDGSGMGMAIIKKLVEWQGGRCWIVSEAGKRGTAVFFQWPAEAHVAPVSGEGGRIK